MKDKQPEVEYYNCEVCNTELIVGVSVCSRHPKQLSWKEQVKEIIDSNAPDDTSYLNMIAFIAKDRKALLESLLMEKRPITMIDGSKEYISDDGQKEEWEGYNEAVREQNTKIKGKLKELK